MTDIGTDFLDNKVTYDSNVPPSWIELVQSKTKIAAAETAEHVSGFNNAIAYRFFPGIPPPPEPTYFLATTKTEWKEGETVTVAGPFDDQGTGRILTLTGSFTNQLVIFKEGLLEDSGR